MFEHTTYIQRRNTLKQQIESGLILLPGNQESPMNYSDNPYPFRQDASFLYYWGLDSPALAAIIDVDESQEVLFGDDLTVDEIVWMGPQPLLREKAEKVGVKNSRPFKELENTLIQATRQNRKIHLLPQYRADNLILLSDLLGVPPARINLSVSNELLHAVIRQRSIKSDEEIAEIESALNITYEMHTLAMRQVKPGLVEREIAGPMEGVALANGVQVSFPIIFSVHGETLHNPYHNNVMQAGDIIVNDSGANSRLHYASDITRTIPVSGKFTDLQKNMYQIVFDAQQTALEMVQSGIKFKDVHLKACTCLAVGLGELGLMKGDVDEAVAAGAHALFFQCGLGHMLGLDVHDMEGLGEDLVGYDEETRRSSQFGLCSLRLGKRLQAGYVITVEPGLYFIPELIDRWKAEKKFTEFIDYVEVEKFRNFGGIRIEEDVVVLEDGYRVLGKPIPKTIADVEELASR